MITDPHFVIYGNEIESKGVQASFPADVSLIKLIGGGLIIICSCPCIAQIFLPLVNMIK